MVMQDSILLEDPPHTPEKTEEPSDFGGEDIAVTPDIKRDPTKLSPKPIENVEKEVPKVALELYDVVRTEFGEGVVLTSDEDITTVKYEHGVCFVGTQKMEPLAEGERSADAQTYLDNMKEAHITDRFPVGSAVFTNYGDGEVLSVNRTLMEVEVTGRGLLFCDPWGMTPNQTRVIVHKPMTLTKFSLKQMASLQLVLGFFDVATMLDLAAVLPQYLSKKVCLEYLIQTGTLPFEGMAYRSCAVNSGVFGNFFQKWEDQSVQCKDSIMKPQARLLQELAMLGVLTKMPTREISLQIHAPEPDEGGEEVPDMVEKDPEADLEDKVIPTDLKEEEVKAAMPESGLSEGADTEKSDQKETKSSESEDKKESSQNEDPPVVANEVPIVDIIPDVAPVQIEEPAPAQVEDVPAQVANAAEDVPPNAVAAPDANADAAPDANVDAAPDANAVAAPDANAAPEAVPEANAAPEPALAQAEAPEVNAAPEPAPAQAEEPVQVQAIVPDANAEIVPEANAAPEPALAQAEEPVQVQAIVPDANAEIVPEANAAPEPAPAQAEEPVQVQAIVPDANVEAVPEVNAAPEPAPAQAEEPVQVQAIVPDANAEVVPEANAAPEPAPAQAEEPVQVQAIVPDANADAIPEANAVPEPAQVEEPIPVQLQAGANAEVAPEANAAPEPAPAQAEEPAPVQVQGDANAEVVPEVNAEPEPAPAEVEEPAPAQVQDQPQVVNVPEENGDVEPEANVAAQAEEPVQVQDVNAPEINADAAADAYFVPVQVDEPALDLNANMNANEAQVEEPALNANVPDANAEAAAPEVNANAAEVEEPALDANAAAEANANAAQVEEPAPDASAAPVANAGVELDVIEPALKAIIALEEAAKLEIAKGDPAKTPELKPVAKEEEVEAADIPKVIDIKQVVGKLPAKESIQTETLEKDIAAELDKVQDDTGKSEAGGESMPSDVGIPAQVEAKAEVSNAMAEAPKQPDTSNVTPVPKKKVKKKKMKSKANSLFKKKTDISGPAPVQVEPSGPGGPPPVQAPMEPLTGPMKKKLKLKKKKPKKLKKKKPKSIKKPKKKEQPQQFKKAWSAGVGFGSSHTGDTSRWDVKRFVKKSKEADKQVHTIMMEVAQFLGTSELADSYILDSCVVPALVHYCQNDSFSDISQKHELYTGVYTLIERMLDFPHIFMEVLFEEHQTMLAKCICKVGLQAESVVAVESKLRNSGETEDPVSKLAQLIKNVFDLVREQVDGLIRCIQISQFMVRDDQSGNDLLDKMMALREQMEQGFREPAPVKLDASNEDYEAVLRDLVFGSCEEMKEFGKHHYIRNKSNMKRRMMKRLAAEFADLPSSLPIHYDSSILFRFCEEQMSHAQMMIIPPYETPYGGGCFIFDIWFPDRYPSIPPKVNLATTGGGSVRFNPNLYASGKVCLSILGTWSAGSQGEGWNPGLSTFLQVAISIQSLVFVPEPYYNEPGYERNMGTKYGDDCSRKYNDVIQRGTAAWAMIDLLKNPPAVWKDVIHAHFRMQGDRALANIKSWLGENSSEAKKFSNLLDNLRDSEN